MQFLVNRVTRLGNRSLNQDRVTALERDNVALLVLGDGLGGKAGGEIASQALVDTISTLFNNTTVPIKEPSKFLTQALHLSHHAVVKAGKAQTPPVNPGTTAVLCLVQNGSAWWAHVGDSRLYLFRGGVPIYRTRDHSVVENLYTAGHIDRERRDNHPMKNVMTRCIGLTDYVPDVQVSNEVPLREGDILMLCSDGLWEPLDDSQMGALIMEGRFVDALNMLAEKAEKVAYPNSDNISAVAIQIMSLQLIGKALSTAAKKSSAQNTKDPVDDAIDVIEETYKLYENEMK